MGCITVLVVRACAELRGSYSNRNGSHMYHNFGLNCPPYTQQYSSPKLGVVRNWGGLLYIRHSEYRDVSVGRRELAHNLMIAEPLIHQDVQVYDEHHQMK